MATNIRYKKMKAYLAEGITFLDRDAALKTAGQVKLVKTIEIDFPEQAFDVKTEIERDRDKIMLHVYSEDKDCLIDFYAMDPFVIGIETRCDPDGFDHEFTDYDTKIPIHLFSSRIQTLIHEEVTEYIYELNR